jgi:hypothetical protein
LTTSRAGSPVDHKRPIGTLAAAAAFACCVALALAAVAQSSQSKRAAATPPVTRLAAATHISTQTVGLAEPEAATALEVDPAEDEIWPPLEAAAAAPVKPVSDRRANVDLSPASQPDEEQSDEAAGDLTTSSAAPTDCLPDALKSVLRDLKARFGSVTIVSTTHLHSENHSARSARARMHAACRAVDIKTSANPRAVIAFLKSRPEVGGVNTYRNKIVHFDLAGGGVRKRVASRRARR